MSGWGTGGGRVEEGVADRGEPEAVDHEAGDGPESSLMACVIVGWYRPPYGEYHSL